MSRRSSSGELSTIGSASSQPSRSMTRLLLVVGRDRASPSWWSGTLARVGHHAVGYEHFGDEQALGHVRVHGEHCMLSAAMLVTYLDARRAALPARMPSPFAPEPHALARRAAAQLRGELRGGPRASGCTRRQDVRRARRRRSRRSHRVRARVLGHGARPLALDGFAPPAFDRRCARCVLARRRGAARRARRADHGRARQRASRRCVPSSRVDSRHAARSDLVELRARHRANVATHVRPHARHAGASPASSTSRAAADTAERRRLDARQPTNAPASTQRLRALESMNATALDEDRAARSRELSAAHLRDVCARERARRATRCVELFAPAAATRRCRRLRRAEAARVRVSRRRCARSRSPSSGAGAPPATGGRQRRRASTRRAAASAARSCRTCSTASMSIPRRCSAADRRRRARCARCSRTTWLAVVDKPVGLLSVPGRGDARDSVQTRLRARYPAATGPLRRPSPRPRHVGARCWSRRIRTRYAALQRLFAERAIDKRYIAWLDGDVRRRAAARSSCRSASTSTIGRARSSTRCTANRRSPSGRCSRARRSHPRRAVAAHRPHASAARARRAPARPRRADRRRSAVRPSGRCGSCCTPRRSAFVHPHTHEHLAWHSPAPF